MNPNLDLIVLPLGQVEQQNQEEIPGFYVAEKPRRVARGRESDRLLMHLALAGNAPLSNEQMHILLEELARIYYQSSGTVTAAQRAVAQALNDYLLERNLRNASTGRQAIGLFTQAVVRGERLALSLSGPTHVLLITATGVEHIHEPMLAGQGLGISRAAGAHYTLTKLRPNDAFLIASHLPAVYNLSNLQGAHGQGPESLRRKVISQIGLEHDGVLIQVREGSGRIHWLRAARPAPAKPMPEAPKPSEARPAPPSVPPAEEVPSSLHPQAIPALQGVPPHVPAAAEAQPASVPPTRQAAQPLGASGAQGAVSGAPPTAKRPARRFTLPLATLAHMFSGVASWGNKIVTAIRPAVRLVGRLLQRMLPDSSLFTIPPYTMAFIAIAVPILVVILASWVYLSRGRAAQFDAYYTQAMEAAHQAQTETDPQALRLFWRTTLEYLDKAERFQRTEASKSLRAQAQSELDRLDYVERLDFQPALSTRALNEKVVITQMAVNGNDLYLLNGAEGVVLRATFTEDGYRLDERFQCGPGTYEGYLVGAIHDIAPLPPGSGANATLLGMDTNGNLLYCTPEDEPKAMPLTPPDTQWSKPTAFVLDAGDLYVLDAESNAVWIYRNLDVSEPPRFFFAAQVPNLNDVIDLAVNNNDLYLLHADGHMTTCAYSALAEAPTRCEDPAAYTDPRPGRETRPLNEEAHFSQVVFAPPPDPSIFLLEPQTPAIYHLSVRLTFQRQFQPRLILSERKATAFAVSRENRLLFLALGNQVYNASLP